MDLLSLAQAKPISSVESRRGHAGCWFAIGEILRESIRSLLRLRPSKKWYWIKTEHVLQDHYHTKNHRPGQA